MKRKHIYKGKIIDLVQETVRVNPGEPEATFEIVRHPGGAVVAAISENRQVCLLRQYRYVVDRWLWELPAGKIDNNESPNHTVVRELREEAGLKADRWHYLGEIISSPGILDEVLHLFVAQGLSEVGIHHEPHEYIEVHWIDLDKALDMAASGEISDAKSIINLIRAANFINSG